MYTGFLHTHSGLRWIVLLLMVVVIIKSFIGWFGNKNFTKLDNILSSATVGLLDLQFLIGLVLYFISPIVQSALDSGNMMSDDNLRFWGVEHVVTMVIAIALAHIGRAKAKKASDSTGKFKFLAIFLSIALLAVVFAIPWERV
ncbi:hypothetical protein [Marinoscillum sp. MHG1-6]|uniref:hypothetical protein n=1 Tax=Marinoscillum sp. MHG1-6 TaxID=2959627 RepID=UPI002156FD80|nr:hypothetical protein [Marinoscillum sp. MHG1-6]